MELKARDMSLVGKIIGVFVILIGSVLAWLGFLENAKIIDVVMVGFSIAGLFGTVDINLMLEKITRDR
jgi:hypothetical protein